MPAETTGAEEERNEPLLARSARQANATPAFAKLRDLSMNAVTRNRHFALSLALLAAAAVGCGSPAGQVSGNIQGVAKTEDLEAQKGYVRQDEVKTGVGNLLMANARRSGSRYDENGQYVDPLRVTIFYQDAVDYFSAAESLKAWVHVHCYLRLKSGVRTTGQQFDLEDVELTRNGPGMPYRGTFDVKLKGTVGDSAEVLDFVDVAVFEGEKWDSNQGKNYRLTLGYSQ